MYDDPLAAAKGIGVGVCFSAVLWAAIISVLLWLT